MNRKNLVNVIALGLLACPTVLTPLSAHAATVQQQAQSSSTAETPVKAQVSAPYSAGVSEGQTFDWGGIALSFDASTGTLTIPGGIITDPPNLVKEPGLDVKKINITGALTLKGNVTNLFNGLNHLTEIEGLNNINTSNVTNMNGMFAYTDSLTSLDLSSFDTSNVTNMNGMFFEAKSLASVDLSSFDTSNVTTMAHMFNEANSLASVDLSSFDTSNVTTMNHMFNNANSLPSLDLSSFDTSKVTDMSYMFASSALVSSRSWTSLDLSSFDTSNVTDMNHMFNNARNLSSLDLSSFDTSNVTDMSLMFCGANSLPSLDLSSFDTSNVTDMNGMFENATSLTSLDLSNFDTSKVTNASSVFRAIPNLSKIKVSPTLRLDFSDMALSTQPDPSEYTGNWVLSDGTTTEPITDAEFGQKAYLHPGTYVWERKDGKIAAEDITVHYQDETGKTLSPDVLLHGNIGEAYKAEQKTIKGYKFKEVKGNSSGQFTAQPQSVTYIYKKETPKPTPTQKVVNVYRLYNKKSMQHLYTADKNEYNQLPKASKDWVREGVNFKEYQKGTSTTQAVYRIYNPKSGEHLNTKDANEVKVLKKQGWKTEGTAFYTPKTGGKSIYRLFNPKAGIGAHFVTGDAHEKDTLTHAPKEWKYEGVAWKSVK